MSIPIWGRSRAGAARTAETGLVLVLLLSDPSAAQEPFGLVRGRVVDANGAPIAGAGVRARSAALTLDRVALTDAHGRYLISALPPGEYVLSFEHPDYILVRHVTRLAIMETVVADATLPPGPASGDVISVSLDGHRLPRTPGVSDVWTRAALDVLPVEGSLYSASTLASGTRPEALDGTLLVVDGAPVRFGPFGGDRPLLDPGREAIDQVSVLPGGVSTAASRFTSGVISVVTRHGGDRFSGSVTAALTDANRLADHVHRAADEEGHRGELGLAVGIPVDGRRTWLFGAGGLRSDRVWQVKGTHAFTNGHRMQGFVLTGARDRDLAPRDDDHRLWSLGYSGIVGGVWQLTARGTRERWVGAGGFGVCLSCPAGEWSAATWRAAADRAVAVGATSHHLTVGTEWSDGERNAESFADAFSTQSLFVSDEWRPAASVTVHAGLRWDRQRLESAREHAVLVSRSGLAPRVLASWRPGLAPGWTLFGGYARYEGDILDVEAGTLRQATRHLLGPAEGTRDVLAPYDEWTAGASRRVGYRIHTRSDIIWRRRSDGAERYAALASQIDYHLSVRTDIGARYTLSQLRTDEAGVPFDLHGDRRHRLRAWGYFELLEHDTWGTAAVTALQIFESGAPLAPGPDAVARTDAAVRTDLMASYMRPLPAGVRSMLQVRFEALNVFGLRRPFDPLSAVSTAADETLSRAYRASIGIRF